jgi:excisionase family DNA binding protein
MDAGRFDSEAGKWSIEVPEQEYYTVQDVSRILGVGAPSVYNYIRRGSLPAYKVGGSTKVKHEDLMQYIEVRQSDQARSPVNEVEKIVPDEEPRKVAQELSGDDGGDETTQINLDLFDDA